MQTADSYIEAGLTLSHLEKLCQSERTERTLQLLFYLNHWAKARERLFFPDRQGLYEVKAVILHYLYVTGSLQAVAYIDGIEGFGKYIDIAVAADLAAESVVERLEGLSDPDPMMANIDGHYNQMAYQFYLRMVGQDVPPPTHNEVFDRAQVREYIFQRLQELEREARTTRQPIPCDELAVLYIAPTELLSITDRRYYYLEGPDRWYNADDSDLRKLDPEGLSLIAFLYSSADSRYVFQLPLRVAETFLEPEQLQMLKSTPAVSREYGEYFGRQSQPSNAAGASSCAEEGCKEGRAVSDEESLQYPIRDILRELGINSAVMCPRQLANKEEYVTAQAMRYLEWDEDWSYKGEDEDEDEDCVVWRDAYTPDKKKQLHSMAYRRDECCPLCNAEIAEAGMPRIQHWREAHVGQDPTISRASWLLNKSGTKEEFCQEIPPDYREAIAGVEGKGTRFWRLETLEKWEVARLASSVCSTDTPVL